MTEKSKFLFLGCLLFSIGSGFSQGTLWRIFSETGDRALEAGRNAEAEENFQAALEEAQARADLGTAEVVYQLALSHHNFALVLSLSGKEDQAVPHYQHSILLMTQSEGELEKALLIQGYLGLGKLHQRKGELPEARGSFEKAMEACQSDLVRGDEAAMKVVDSLGRNYLLQDQRKEAERLYRRVIGLLEQRPRENARQIARLLGVLGDLYETRGSPLLADALYRRSVELYEQGGVRDGQALGAALVRRARMDLGKRDVEAAAEGFRRALSLFRQLDGSESFEMAEALQAQAKLRQQDGDFDQAIGLAREALTILQETSHPRSREVTFSCFLTLATSHRDKGKLQVAASLFRRMIQRYQDQPEYRGQVEKEYADLLGNLGKSEQEAEALARGVDMKTDPVR